MLVTRIFILVVVAMVLLFFYSMFKEGEGEVAEVDKPFVDEKEPDREISN